MKLLLLQVFSAAAVLLGVGLAAPNDCISLRTTQRTEDWKGLKCLWWDSLSGNIYNAICCKEGSEGEAKNLKNKDACLTTPHCATNSGGGPLCPEREMADGSGRIIHEEVIRDNCVDAAGRRGFVAQCCPKNSTEGMLLSMMGAELGEFPHQVGVQSSGNCGGTIYNKNHVITASHCVIDSDTGLPMDASAFTIQAGTSIGGHAGFDSQDSKYKVEAVLHHEDYSKLRGQPEFPKGNYGTTYNDIALLRIKGEFNFTTDRVKALEIAPEGFVPDQYAPLAILAGWGTTDTLETSPNLQKSNVKIHSDRDCLLYNYDEWNNGAYPGYNKYKDQFLCVGGIFKKEWGAMAGGGDSGGPAICRGPSGNPVLCGVTSFGTDDDKCVEHKTAEFCKPSIYAEVAYFRRNWDLLKRAGPQDPSTLFRYKLYGDEDLPADKYTHQVHITSAHTRPCGGTLVKRNVVVTAAQCAFVIGADDGKIYNYGGLEVTYGIRDLNAPTNSAGKVIRVKSAVQYGVSRSGAPVNVSDQYNHEKGFSRILMTDNYYKNDIAVLTLEEDVDIDERLLPQLPDSRYTASGDATELAFPRDTRHGSKLRARQFKFVPKDNCQARLDRLSTLGVESKLDEEVICAVEKYSGGSTCDRELGGGLICKGRRGEEILCGVQIFRLCDFSIPNGFLNPARYGIL